MNFLWSQTLTSEKCISLGCYYTVPNCSPISAFGFIFTVYTYSEWFQIFYFSHTKSSSWAPDGILLPTNRLYLDALQIPQNTWWKLKCCSHFYLLYPPNLLLALNSLLESTNHPHCPGLYTRYFPWLIYCLYPTGQSPSPDNSPCLLFTSLFLLHHYLRASSHCFTLGLLQQLLNWSPCLYWALVRVI